MLNTLCGLIKKYLMDLSSNCFSVFFWPPERIEFLWQFQKKYKGLMRQNHPLCTMKIKSYSFFFLIRARTP